MGGGESLEDFPRNQHFIFGDADFISEHEACFDCGQEDSIQTGSLEQKEANGSIESKQEEKTKVEEAEVLSASAIGPTQVDASIFREAKDASSTKLKVESSISSLNVFLLVSLFLLLMLVVLGLLTMLQKERKEGLRLKKEKEALVHELFSCSRCVATEVDLSNDPWNSILNLEHTRRNLITRWRCM